jgi:outer membrane biosynthesis protein TonB
MIGLKRYIRPGLAVSVIGHLAALIVGFFFIGANAFHAPPPEAMVVEVVAPDEMPRFEGMPSNLHSSGSETPSPANGNGPVTQAPPPQPRPQQQQSQQHPTPQREAKEAPAPRPPAPEATQAELVRAEKTEPEKQNQSSEAQTASSPPEQTPQQPNIAEAVAQYAALGGPLGGGFAAPPVDTNAPGYDWTMPFRERVGMCSKRPEGAEPGDKFSIKIRISFNRDGTLESPPRLLVPTPSAKQRALMESAVDALQTCQPFTMLPPEKYRQWKTMEVYVIPLFAQW